MSLVGLPGCQWSLCHWCLLGCLLTPQGKERVWVLWEGEELQLFSVSSPSESYSRFSPVLAKANQLATVTGSFPLETSGCNTGWERIVLLSRSLTAFKLIFHMLALWCLRHRPLPAFALIAGVPTLAAIPLGSPGETSNLLSVPPEGGQGAHFPHTQNCCLRGACRIPEI